MKPSPTAVIARAAAISALGLAILLTAGEAMAQSRNGGFQNSFRSQAIGQIGNQQFAIQRANQGSGLRNQIFSNPNRLSANRDRRTPFRPFAPLPLTPPSKNAGNGGGNQTVFFAPLPQTPPSNNNGGNGGGNRGGNGGGFQRLNPLPQAPQSGSGQRARSNGSQFIVLPATPPANRPARVQTAALQPPATDLIATAAPRQAPVETVKAPEDTRPAPIKVRGIIKHFVVKFEQRYYHVAKTAGDEYLLMGYVDSDFRYHKWQR